jgi:hypothetical protein
VSDPKSWGRFEEALASIRRHDGLAGVGFVLTDQDGITGIDLDHCISDSGSFSDLAAEIISYNETYAEISPSGEGIRILARGKIDKALKSDALGVELYGTGRYLTVTGRQIDGTPSEIMPAPRTISRLIAVAESHMRGASRPKENGNAGVTAEDFFGSVNAAALARLDDWVPLLHPTARKHATGAWRVSSRDLGRDLEEDLAYHPGGTRDHGEERGLSGIDAVRRYGDASDATAAAMWLCQKLRVEPTSLGWQGATSNPRKNTAERSTAEVKAWPILRSKAKHGLVGEIASLATENSEADPVAVMMTVLAWSGALFGRNRYMSIGDDEHHPRLYGALVGSSSVGRKGTSLGPVRKIMAAVEGELQKKSTLPFPSGASLKVSHGPLSTGEGLIAAVRDKHSDDDDGGVDDKRLLCIESELGAALRACQRQGNTLSSVLRAAWDGWTLEPLIKTDRIRASSPHICLIAHITRQELDQLLTSSDIWNGFSNRFLWAAVRRAKSIPFPKPMADADVRRIGAELARVIEYAHSRDCNDAQLVMSNSAQSFYVDCYAELTQEHAGILGAVTSRAAAQAQRLAMTFALLDGADRIEQQHVEAGLTFWRYCFDSAAYIFKGAEIDPVAQTIIAALTTGAKSQTEISGLFDRHLPKERLGAVLTDLQERGRITLTLEKTAGAPRRMWVWHHDAERNKRTKRNKLSANRL